MTGINSNYPSYGDYSRPWERLNGTPLESIGKTSPGNNQLHGGEIEAHMRRYDPDAYSEYMSLKKQNAGKTPMQLLEDNPALEFMSAYSGRQRTTNGNFIAEAKQAYQDDVHAWTDEDVDHLFKTYYDSPAGQHYLSQQNGKAVAGYGAADVTPAVKPQQTYGESRLSVKAQSYLKTLQSKLGDFDIFVADSDDDHKRILNSGSKEFSVTFSSEELEKMADDPEYAKEQLSKLQTIVDMSRKISEQFGFEPAFGQTVTGKGDILRSLTVSTDKDGNLQFFAELEKLSEKQRERIEEKREESRADRTKAVTISASSEEDLIKKLSEIDWDAVPEKEHDPESTIEYRV